MATPSSRRRQPLLLQTAGPWTSRFGAGFFQSLPAAPGVYFFYDAGGGLLYIGQSRCLKDRIGSYRHAGPERHPRRILRLIQRTSRIEWNLCASPGEAVALEAALLLEHRPPFNRAGVWPRPGAWVGLHTADGKLELRMGSQCGAGISMENGSAPGAGTEDWEWIGPLPGRLRSAFAPMARCLFRAMNPQTGWWDYPSGLLGPDPGPVHTWRLPDPSAPWLNLLRRFLTEGCPEFLTLLPDQISGPDLPESVGRFWSGQLDHLIALDRALGRWRKESLEK